MKVLLKSLFLALTLSIISFAAIAADATDVVVDDDTIALARRCCTFQVDCLDNQECVTISPACSADKANICQKKKVAAVADAPVTPDSLR